MKTIVIHYEETQRPDNNYARGEALDLFDYLRNEFDNAGIVTEIHEFDTPEQAAQFLAN